ncbi:glycoside hydrolase family 43 protein [Chitinophaga sp. S165]|uniref:glycoside hydrolase family 43 protein n=1 Tax=Chitinophaga sp. S165 TaxID=2135462 RepID=UPI000D70D087|nr:glycoside hydrolase family 43 protein [Chitinophaga sp. S165]PWV48908.1 glycosyl hydrolase family 43 [Chitinophaga sp. S165]
MIAVVSTFKASGNPVIRHKYTCDPTALVHEGAVYLFTGHDEAPVGTEDYVMHDWLCFSSVDMTNWVEYAVPLKAADFSWSGGDAYASKIIYHKGSFYWYVAVSHPSGKGTAIGVAVASSPAGPYADALGSAMITHDMLPETSNKKANLDPSVLVDDDGKAYIFWGNGTCYFARLKENMTALDGPIQIIDLPGFEEGAHIHKRDGWYYLCYGYGMPEKVAYAMSRDINGPWVFKGILNEIAGNCETNRPCIIEYGEQPLFIYHNGGLKNGGSHRRSVCIDHLSYNEDSTLRRIVMTSEGVIRR